MASLVRMRSGGVSAGTQAMPATPPGPGIPAPQDGWCWDGSVWGPCWDFDDCPPCPPSGFFPPPPWFSPPTAPWMPGANGGVGFGATPPQNPIRGMFWWDGTGLAMFDGAVWVNTTSAHIVPPGATIGSVGGVSGGGSGTSGNVVVQPTPPASPTIGLEWWNGSVLQMWDGTMWKTIGPGAAAGPTPTTMQVFSINQPTAQTIPTGAVWTIIPFAGVTPQVDVLNGWNSTNYKYTPNKPGVYGFFCRGLGHGGITSQGIVIAKNDPGSFASGLTDISVTIQQTSGPGWMTAYALAPMNGTTDFVRLFGETNDGTWGATGSNAQLQVTLLP